LTASPVSRSLVSGIPWLWKLSPQGRNVWSAKSQSCAESFWKANVRGCGNEISSVKAAPTAPRSNVLPLVADGEHGRGERRRPFQHRRAPAPGAAPSHGRPFL